MVLNYYINFEFEGAKLAPFVDFINSCSPEQDLNLNLYLTSPGGDYIVSQIIKDMIETSEHHITLIAGEDISSSAFILFYETNCNKRILNRTHALIHSITTTYSERELRKDSLSFKQNANYMKEINKYYHDLFKANSALNKTQLDMFNKGEDIIVNHEELIKIMKKCPFGKLLLDK